MGNNLAAFYELTDKQEVPEPINEAVLKVVNVNIHSEDNHKEHHTDKFCTANDALIVRRGQPFRITLDLNRPYNPSEDAVSFIFIVADNEKPSPGHGTIIGIVPKDTVKSLSDTPEWAAGIEAHKNSSLTVLIKPAVTSPVTEWILDIDTKLLGNGSRTYNLKIPIYVLFNPWCRQDQVYLDNGDELMEYVMNDTTLMWRGSYNNLKPSAWKIGQFDIHVLECSLRLLGRLSAAYRGDPVRVAKALTASVNSIDDDGVLLGNWSEEFSGGIAPTEWLSSAEILQQFYKTKKPVKYGQCWTFAGVLTTIARAIGIPSRIVTCYSPARDSEASLTIDVFVDQNNEKMAGDCEDSIWIYHAWNEVWMARPDLGAGQQGLSYDGWQALDATPQVVTKNKNRVGPASLAAVKNGESFRPFDCGFLFSEVNADMVYWRFNGLFKPIKLLRTDTLNIGRLITTKAVLKWDYQDITNLYKSKTKTYEERNSLLKVLKQSHKAFSRYYLNDTFDEVDFNMQLNDDKQIGESFTVVASITNKCEEETHTAIGRLTCDSVWYTGINNDEVKSITFEKEIKPGETVYINLEVEFEEYFKNLSKQALFNISYSASVKNTDYDYFDQDYFCLRKPNIKISFNGAIVSQQPVDVTVSLINPLPIPIKKSGMFLVDGTGMESVLRFKIVEIAVGGDAEFTFTYVPPYAGSGTLLAKFTSKELDDVDGYMHYEIK